MRKILSLIIATICFLNIQAQQKQIVPETLTPKQVTELFTEPVRSSLNITFPIFRVYKYTDKADILYCVLTESQDKINAGKDSLNSQIKAIQVKFENGQFIKLWEINDQLIKDKEEKSIWFWTKYADFKDADADGLGDPIIVYGTTAVNGYGDGRIKIIIYYKGQKVAIRHQNGTLDFERETSVDKAFYALPVLLQTAVKQKMELMIKNKQAIFPAGWQLAMKNKKTTINERG